MDVLITPEIFRYLELSGSFIWKNKECKTLSLLAFSETYIVFITDSSFQFDTESVVEIRTKNEIISLRVIFETVIKTSSKHWIYRFSYSVKEITGVLQEKWKNLLTIKEYQQVRKDVRLSMTTEFISQVQLKSIEIQIWFLNVQKNCILYDLSFSGARLYTIDDFEIECNDSLLMKLSFINPNEIASLRAVVNRKRTVLIDAIACAEIAVRFVEPLDFVFLSRLSYYFQNHT
jgi:hypothetical protein